MEQNAEAQTTLVLVRHGETEWNLEGRWQGQRDSRLTALGREQASRTATRLSRMKISAVYTSDLGRARQVAQLIAAPHGLPLIEREDLRERSYGVLEGKTDQEAAASERSWYITWKADHLHLAAPGGETYQMLCDRVVNELYEIVKSHPGETVVVSTHGGPIKCALYYFLSIPLSLWRLTWVANGSITVLRGSCDVMRTATFNDICHLESIPTSEKMED